MRKTRLVILPTKCLHQMGFLLLFLSCPVIGDWGRIRPESENSHKAIQIEREGSCGLQRDPPGKLLSFLYENGSNQCQLSEDFDSNGITNKPMLRRVWRYDNRRVDFQRTGQEKNLRERREADNERRDVGRTMNKSGDERRYTRRETQREVRKNREMTPIRQSNSRDRHPDNERATMRKIIVSERRFSKSNEIYSRNERERLHQTRRLDERQNERRIEQQRRSAREIKEWRENARSIRTALEIEEGQTQRLARERQDFRRENRRSVPDLKRESDVIMRQSRERNQDRHNERLSLARREQHNSRISIKGRNAENTERSLSKIRKIQLATTDGGVTEQRMSRVDNRQDSDQRKLSRRDVRDVRQVALLSEGMNRMMEIKSRRVSDLTKLLPKDFGQEIKNNDEKFFGGISKWMDLERFESLKAGDWTTNCIIGAVVYFFSTKQIKTA